MSRSSIGRLGYGLLAYVGLLLVMGLALPGGALKTAVIDVGLIVPPLVASVLFWRASRLPVDWNERWAWRLLSVAFAFTALGFVVHAGYGVLLGHLAPRPSVADAGFLLFYPLAGAAVWLLIHRVSTLGRGLTAILDGLIFTLGVAGLWWQLLVGGALLTSGQLLSAGVVVAYPVGDILILFALASIFLGSTLDGLALPALFLVLGFFVNVATDLLYAWRVLTEQYATGGPDVLWMLAYVLMALAAVVRMRSFALSSGEETPRPAFEPADLGSSRYLWMSLPYLSFPAAAWLLYDQSRSGDRLHSGWVVAFAVALLALVMARQFLTLVENHQLSHSLLDLSRDLEGRVEQRTEQLSERTRQLDALNQVASALSRCLTTEDVLACGVGLSLRAFACTAGVVWLRGEHEIEVATHRGLDDTTLCALAGLPNEPGPVAEAFAGIGVTMFRGGELETLALAGGADSTLLVVPLMSRGAVLGAVGLLTDGERELRDDELQLQRSIGAQLGLALENARQYDRARFLADRDSVTGLLNHRSLHERLENEVYRAQRAGRQFSMVMMDLDNFKLFNDTYGHPIGDDVLREVAELLAQTVRTSDVAGRYGGDEFMMILPETDSHGAVEMVQRMRELLDGHPFLAPDGLHVPVRLSFGVASYPDHGRKLNELIGYADANLYLSKEQGGDTVTAGVGGQLDDISDIGIFSILQGLLSAVDNKDRYTRCHSDEVTAYALALASQLALPDETHRSLRMAGMLHDVGKIGVPDRILRKPARLTDDEYEVLKRHALLSEMIVKEVPHLGEVMAAVGSHHERYDGAGYPRGLKGEEIPLMGRILAVADAYAAMTTDRPYRKALTPEAARAELRAVAGTQLDAAIVDAFLLVLGDGKPRAVKLA